jgi:putative transposase
LAQKKALSVPREDKRAWIEPSHQKLSVTRQCVLSGLNRSSYYYEPQGTQSEENLQLMRVIDELYLKRPFYGVPRMTWWLWELGHAVNHKRVERLMRVMGLQAVVPGPHTSRPHPEHRIYPYLLRGLKILAPDQVWCADITYVPMRRGYLYLVAVMDWFSRYVLTWELSNSLEAVFCCHALDRALERACPGIFNSDQGAQFTSEEFTGRVLDAGIRISMDGRGRVTDNIFIERLWRSVKYEEIYLRDYADGIEARRGLDRYFRFYNTERPHQSLGNRTPADQYFARN